MTFFNSSYNPLKRLGKNESFPFLSVLPPFQDYFSSYKTGQSVGGGKEKPPGTPASITWLVSHVLRVGLEPTLDTVVRKFTFISNPMAYDPRGQKSSYCHDPHGPPLLTDNFLT